MSKLSSAFAEAPSHLQCALLEAHGVHHQLAAEAALYDWTAAGTNPAPTRAVASARPYDPDWQTNHEPEEEPAMSTITADRPPVTLPPIGSHTTASALREAGVSDWHAQQCAKAHNVGRFAISGKTNAPTYVVELSAEVVAFLEAKGYAVEAEDGTPHYFPEVVEAEGEADTDREGTYTESPEAAEVITDREDSYTKPAEADTDEVAAASGDLIQGGWGPDDEDEEDEAPIAKAPLRVELPEYSAEMGDGQEGEEPEDPIDEVELMEERCRKIIEEHKPELNTENVCLRSLTVVVGGDWEPGTSVVIDARRNRVESVDPLLHLSPASNEEREAPATNVPREPVEVIAEDLAALARGEGSSTDRVAFWALEVKRLAPMTRRTLQALHEAVEELEAAKRDVNRETAALLSGLGFDSPAQLRQAVAADEEEG